MIMLVLGIVIDVLFIVMEVVIRVLLLIVLGWFLLKILGVI